MKENGEEDLISAPALNTQPICRFFSQGRQCNYGKKCRFQHIRDDVKAHEKKTIRTPSQSDVTSLNSDVPGGHLGQRPAPNSNSRVGPASVRRPCRYFISGHCSMEDRCRFWHPPQFPQEDDQPVSGNYPRPAQRMPPVPRPGILQEVKLCDLTEDVTKQLRDTEINQLKKRFPKEQLIIQERSDGMLTYYRATVEATDPDWPFDLKAVDIMVSFPESYPQEIFTLDIPLDQELPLIMSRYSKYSLFKYLTYRVIGVDMYTHPCLHRHVQQASLQWLQAKHATNQLMGKVELLFRPFLRWLDRSLERLFTEGARQLKKDVDLEKAGLQFISYQELQATVCERSGNDSSDTAAADEDVSDEGKLEYTEGEKTEEGGIMGQQDGSGCDRGQQQEEERKPGAWWRTLRSVIPAEAPRPCMLHHYSDVLGYLDLHNAAPVDLVLQDCDLIVGCLSCSQESPVQNVCYGQTKESNCEHCHSKLSILAESTRFQYIQPRTNKTGSSSGPVYNKTIRDPAVQKGKPLPEKGSCKHYKQSHRWLRFPCCGRAYPCDGCHDEDQDHPMELATRMICGYCAKEQPYGNGKPCSSCGSMMTRGTRTSHWEGGLGCRSKVKMSRNDRHKYANTNKTISRKAVSVKK
ncbi:hypothetical protein F7725_022863 [Dissostichus mawsoni]|uniref:Nucleoporin NUP42 n=1 Tax=Dissostichus mawsoni TaxID=36200 RepID=A0A7J5Z3A4_DISMA|nr:hypothetical protein F7725_022863 [Dissostichus mawsoni]